MDRNLGALAATEIKPAKADAYKYFGVLYQHGRPTPFSGQGIGETINRYTIIYKGDATAINSNNTEGIGGYTQSNTAVPSVTDAIKTPNTYYYRTSSPYTWYNFNDISLWSDYGTNKSIYDPCPYGYRVPINGSWSSWTSTTAWADALIDAGAVWSSIWWPAAGTRSYSSGVLYNIGAHAFYWSSTYASTYTSYSLRFYYSGNVNPSDAYYRSLGFSVRCVQERGRFAWDLGRGTWERCLRRVMRRGGVLESSEAETRRTQVVCVGIVCTAHQGVGVPWRCFATTVALLFSAGIPRLRSG